MTTIAHLSDLHFGRVDERTLAPLRAQVHALAPDLIAVSGDLTQRARAEEFRAARAFLDTLPSPQVVVPGNHDVPLFRLWRRALHPLRDFRRFVTGDLAPFVDLGDVIVVGINTARAATTSHGRINEAQVAKTRARLDAARTDAVRVVVTHHPLDVPNGHRARRVGRAHMAMVGLAASGADVFLAGHLHVSHVIHTSARYRIAGHSALVVQAGTATSTRVRGGAPNSFNLLRLDREHIEVDHLMWDARARRFTVALTERSIRTADGWAAVDAR